MKKLVYKGIIEDVRHEKCTKLELVVLIGIFEEAVKNMRDGLNISSYQNLEDFCDSDKYGFSQFILSIERKITKEEIDFIGQFSCGNKNLKIIANQKS